MAVKLNKLVENFSLHPLQGTFAALAEFCESSEKKAASVPFGTLAAIIASGERVAFAPILPRGLRLNTAADVVEADLDVLRVEVEPLSGGVQPDIIVSGHAATMELLAEYYPQAVVIPGNVVADDVRGHTVVGTLPPHLVAEADGYIPVSIVDFDYARDGDISGKELLRRLRIGEPIRVHVS